jgi:hypothetical protein
MVFRRRIFLAFRRCVRVRLGRLVRILGVHVMRLHVMTKVFLVLKHSLASFTKKDFAITVPLFVSL